MAARFHVLTEFDEAKRSCRKRLADHNRRRRKPQFPAANADSSAPENPTTNSMEKSKQTAKAPRENCNEPKLQLSPFFPFISLKYFIFDGLNFHFEQQLSSPQLPYLMPVQAWMGSRGTRTRQPISKPGQLYLWEGLERWRKEAWVLLVQCAKAEDTLQP